MTMEAALLDTARNAMHNVFPTVHSDRPHPFDRAGIVAKIPENLPFFRLGRVGRISSGLSKENLIT